MDSEAERVREEAIPEHDSDKQLVAGLINEIGWLLLSEICSMF